MPELFLFCPYRVTSMLWTQSRLPLVSPVVCGLQWTLAGQWGFKPAIYQLKVPLIFWPNRHFTRSLGERDVREQSL